MASESNPFEHAPAHVINPGMAEHYHQNPEDLKKDTASFLNFINPLGGFDGFKVDAPVMGDDGYVDLQLQTQQHFNEMHARSTPFFLGNPADPVDKSDAFGFYMGVGAITPIPGLGAAKKGNISTMGGTIEESMSAAEWATRKATGFAGWLGGKVANIGNKPKVTKEAIKAGVSKDTITPLEHVLKKHGISAYPGFNTTFRTIPDTPPLPSAPRASVHDAGQFNASQLDEFMGINGMSSTTDMGLSWVGAAPSRGGQELAKKNMRQQLLLNHKIQHGPSSLPRWAREHGDIPYPRYDEAWPATGLTPLFQSLGRNPGNVKDYLAGAIGAAAIIEPIVGANWLAEHFAGELTRAHLRKQFPNEVHDEHFYRMASDVFPRFTPSEQDLGNRVQRSSYAFEGEAERRGMPPFNEAWQRDLEASQNNLGDLFNTYADVAFRTKDLKTHYHSIDPYVRAERKTSTPFERTEAHNFDSTMQHYSALKDLMTPGTPRYEQRRAEYLETHGPEVLANKELHIKQTIDWLGGRISTMDSPNADTPFSPATYMTSFGNRGPSEWENYLWSH